jgi:hypothetical protein
MQRLRSSYTSSDPNRSSVPGSIAAADRNLRAAEVISLDAARAIFRPQVPEHRMTAAEIIEGTREHALRGFFLRDEPLLRFRDFDAGP